MSKSKQKEQPGRTLPNYWERAVVIVAAVLGVFAVFNVIFFFVGNLMLSEPGISVMEAVILVLALVFYLVARRQDVALWRLRLLMGAAIACFLSIALVFIVLLVTIVRYVL